MSKPESAPHSRRRDVIIVLALTSVLLIGGALRFFNVNWDEGTYHIHPDERHTTMVVTAIQWPASLSEYFDTSNSPLNPRNAGTVYFYGTLPLFLTKAVATVLDMTGYDEMHLVGRVLSALFDLGSVLLLYFVARRLFDWRVGLAASFLLALTVLNIQGSHYFAVDTFLTFFVLLTLWFTFDVAEGKGWPSFVALGIGMGLTLSCKVSVFLLAGIVALGAWMRLRRQVAEGAEAGQAALRALLGLILAAALAVALFRVVQPYAFAGPNYDGWDQIPAPWDERLRVVETIPEPLQPLLMPNPQWIADIGAAGAQQTGIADLPWGRQWTERTPWIYPLENMVLWGMGVPLGVAAWIGVMFVVVQLLRGLSIGYWVRGRLGVRDPGARAPGTEDPGIRGSSSVLRPSYLVILPLAWVLLTFVWQGMQYVKSIRYFLPIYPFLVMFAAYLVISAWDWARGRRWGAKLAAAGLAAVVMVGTLAWAFAFIQIYTEPVTRVQATRWMYENVESAATLHYRTADGETGQLQIPTDGRHIYGPGEPWHATAFVAPADLIATELVMNDLTGLEGPSAGTFAAAITEGQLYGDPLTEGEVQALFGGEGGQRHVIDIPDVALDGGQFYVLQTRATRGGSLLCQGAAIANEHFDDPLPFNMDGRLAFGAGQYQGLDLTLYDEDTPEKLEKLLDVLDEADYISMSSGRLWQSIPRLPMRYPVTTRYYEKLFAEELGFEKAVEFHSYPRIFGIEFDDTWAEEQFTVYDHPKVLIYRKTEEYSREQVEAILSEGIVWEEIAHWLNPRDVPEWRREHERQQQDEDLQEEIQGRTNDLKLTEAQRQLQEEGGTWASIFDRNSLANRWPTLTWLVLVGLIGLASLPLTLGVFQRLPDRGYILARPVGVLLLAWLSWILTSLTPLHYSRGTILLALGLIGALSWGSLLLPGQRRRLADLWRTKKAVILTSEVLFLAFFLIFWLIRWGNPDLWHAWKGGEKPMDLAYLNAVIKSTEFPPYDPWFSGGYLNYYYFGQVMVGTLIKLIGIVPAVAYNLAVALWFAMTAMGAFSVTYNLVANGDRGDERAEDSDGGAGAEAKEPRRTGRLGPLAAGLVGALFVAVLGNLAQVHLILLKVSEGVLDSFQSTIPGLASLVRVVVGSFEVLFGGRALPIGVDQWYWNASRAIPAGPYESVITEFPFFTHLYADLHAHLIAMPLAFVSLAAAIAVVKGRERDVSHGWRDMLWTVAPLLLWALAIGALRITNAWDVPPHLILAFGALAIGEYAQRGRVTWGLVGSLAWKFGLLFGLSWWLLYWPFWEDYGAFYDSLGLWGGTRTPIWAYVVVHGLFLFLIVSYLVARSFGHGPGQRPDPWLRRLRLTIRYRKNRDRLHDAAGIVGVRQLPVSKWVWAAIAVLVLVAVILLVPGLIPGTGAHPEAAESGAHAYRGLGVLALGLPIGVLGLLLLFRSRLSPTERLWALVVLLGLAMSLGVEVLVLQGDIGRMNTVFKFYLQVWLMWGVAAAAALAWMVPRVRRWSQGRVVWYGVLAVLLLFAALYPPLAIAAKVGDRFDTELGPGLDGWAYMETARYWDPSGQEYDLKWDLEAIRWLLDNVVGSPVILEGHTPEYRWGGRYSINTGLPTVLGWNWHQRQQRAAAGTQEVWDRASDVETIYSTGVPVVAEGLLDQYQVRYIVVGPLERAYYDPGGLAKFDALVGMGKLQVVFRNEGVTIFEVID
jgi:YYY domain-containing protein